MNVAVTIRLSRTGRVHLPFYHIAVFDSRTRRDGRPIERLGFYDPEAKKESCRLDADRAKHWLSVGARPSATVATLLKERGFSAADWTPAPRKASKPKKKVPQAKKIAAEKARKVGKRSKARTANSKVAAEKKVKKTGE